MFFVISWRCVVNVVADMRTMRMTVTIRVFVVVAWVKVSDSCAPKICACSACRATSWVIGPIGSRLPSEMSWSPLRTRNRPKKNGLWTRIGRHELNGFVFSRRYRAIVSSVIAWRDAGSVLPLYFFWIFCSSGWISCILREAMICRTNSGIISARMTMTRPTIDRPHVQPDASGMPMAVNAWWKPYMIHATIHSIGPSMVLRKSMPSFIYACRCPVGRGGEAAAVVWGWGAGSVAGSVGSGISLGGDEVGMLVRVLRRHVVDPAERPGVAPEQPPDREVGPLQRAEPLERGDGIRGARRVVPAARRGERGDEQLVGADEPDEWLGQQPADAHVDTSNRRITLSNNGLSAVESSADVADAAAGWARMTTSTPDGMPDSRAATSARSRRRVRLRTTALPTALDTTKPTRGG